MERKDFLKSLALFPLLTCNMKLQDLSNMLDKSPSGNKMPALFIGHGSPMNALEDNSFSRSLRDLGKTFQTEGRKPVAVLVVSAHWLTEGTYVCVNPKPDTIHDFGGFPKALFDMQYPAPGAPEVARETAKLNPDIQETDGWGLDHGAWTLLVHMFPNADIPVFQMSIDYYKPLEYHLTLAKQLKSLREKGVLVLGSGNIVHNLRMSMGRFSTGDSAPYDWAVEFDQWVAGKIAQGDYNALARYEAAGNAGKLSVPTPDHYIPMLYTLGLSDDKEPVKQIYESVEFGGISMRSFQIG